MLESVRRDPGEEMIKGTYNLGLAHGCNQDCGVGLHAFIPPGVIRRR
jgi:hypothetical protein